MLNYYREIYGLNGSMKELEKEFSSVEGVEVYPLQPYDMGFIEISASSKNELQQKDQECSSKIISFCENRKIETHSFGPLMKF
jgi:hypothetical protein